MEGKKNLIEKYTPAFLYVMYTVGIIGHLNKSSLELMKDLTPFTLLLTGGIVIYILILKNKKIIMWLITTYIITIILEIIGVKSGLVFGYYSYGDVLGLEIMGVPLVIGLNWVLVILGAFYIADKFFENSILKIFAAAVLAVIFDLIVEPIAINLGYWNWAEGIIPLQNFIAWFFIALSFSYFYHKMNYKINTSIPIHYFLVQFIFFVILNMTL